MKPQGQNTLLVTTTPSDKVKYEAAHELKCFHPGIRLPEALRLMLSRYTLLGEGNDKDSKVAINLLYSKYLNLIELKMVQLSNLQKVALQTLIKEINSGHRGLTNSAFLQSLYGLLLFARKEEYFGKLKGKPQVLKIQLSIRPKRNYSTKHVGVGYKDKGTAKVVSCDGSPSWQEITATGEAKLDEIIRANSQRLKGKVIKSLRNFQSIEVGITNFGNPRRVDLEEVEIDSQRAWLYVRPYGQECFENFLIEKFLSPINRRYRKKLRPARDGKGNLLFLE